MPKKVWKIEEFDGGINQKSDARDLEKNELAEAFNVDISNKGLIKLPGNGKILYQTLNGSTTNVCPTLSESSLFTNTGFISGRGLFHFSHDFNMSSWGNTDSGNGGSFWVDSEFICIGDGANIHLWCDTGTESYGDFWFLKVLRLGLVHQGSIINSAGGEINSDSYPVYYKSGNALKVCDGNFSVISAFTTKFVSETSSNIIVINTPIAFDLPSDDSSYDAVDDLHHLYNYIKINDEIMAVVAVAGDGVTLTVFRGQFGTQQQTHSANDRVELINVPRQLISFGPDNVGTLIDWRLKNAVEYSDTNNTTIVQKGPGAYHTGWRETIQCLEPPHNYMIPGLTVYDGKVTAMAVTGLSAPTTDGEGLYNEPSPEYGSGGNDVNAVITSDSNPEKVLFSIHESKSAEDNVIVGESTDDGGVVSGENAITVTGVTGTDFTSSGFVVGETVVITGSSVTNGIAEILSNVSATVIQITGEHEPDEGSGFEIRLEKDRISEDLLNKYVFGMSFLYDGGGSEVQESPITMGQVHSGLISHDASICRSASGWKTTGDLVTYTDLASTTSTWIHKDGQIFFDDSEVSGAKYLAYQGTAITDVPHKIVIDVEIVNGSSSGSLTIYPPGADGSGGASSGGTVGDGSGDSRTLVIDKTGTYLFYATPDDTTTPNLTNLFVCANIEGQGDVKINNVQVFKATPTEMNASNAISMQGWNGVPKIFSSFNMSNDTNYKWAPEIIGYKIYMKQVDSVSQSLTDEWLLALRVNFREGEFINYSNNSEPQSLHLYNSYVASTGSSFSYTQVCTNKVGGNASGLSYYDTMRDIPLHTYESENGYKANVTTCAMYKTAVQVGRKMYIGNLLIDGMRYPDRMLESPTDRPDTFPNDGLHFIDVATADGDDIIHLDALGNKLIQFKKKTAYVIEILDEGVELLETWTNAGILAPSQVVKAGDGLVWVNNYGLFYYDGDKLTTITAESFDLESWIINENQQNATILGYDAYSKKVIIMTSNLSTHDNGGYIYDIETNSMVEHQNLFDWYSVDAGFQ